MMYHKICPECNSAFDTTYGKKVYCTRKCTVAFNNHKKYNKYAEGKIQCRLCGGWFVKPIAHSWQIHHIEEHEYKEMFDLPFKRGIIPEWHRKILAERVIEDGTIENLKKGANRRYTKNDPRAKVVTGWKGRNGSKGYNLNKD
jgi:hypothetical protein